MEVKVNNDTTYEQGETYEDLDDTYNSEVIRSYNRKDGSILRVYFGTSETFSDETTDREFTPVLDVHISVLTPREDAKEGETGEIYMHQEEIYPGQLKREYSENLHDILLSPLDERWNPNDPKATQLIRDTVEQARLAVLKGRPLYREAFIEWKEKEAERTKNAAQEQQKREKAKQDAYNKFAKDKLSGFEING